MTNIPSFKLKSTVTKADFEAFKASEGKRGPRLQPGEQELTIIKAEVHAPKNPPVDPTWFQVKLTLLAGNGAEKMHFISIPTQDLKYNDDRFKDPLFMFGKLAELLEALGEPSVPGEVEAVIPQLFGNLDNLVGRKVIAVAGYKDKTYHIDSVEGGAQIMQHDGYPFRDKNQECPIFPDFASAKAAAESYNLKLGYVEILKFKPAEVRIEDAGW